MSAPYGREMTIVKKLESDESVQIFVPMKRFERMVGHKLRRRVISYRPVVRNLLFIQTTATRMRLLKRDYNRILQFKVHLQDGLYTPIIVPDKQMADFMKLYQNVDASQLEFFTPDDIQLRPNARVRIQDGIFEGLEGYYQRVKGMKKKRFVVKIEGFLACAAFLTDCSYVSCVEEG